MGSRKSSHLMGEKGITGYVALSIVCSELFRAEENSNPAHNSDPKGSANRTLVPTQNTVKGLGLNPVQQTFGS